MNKEKLSIINKWYTYEKMPPYLDKLLLVFRDKNKKYCIACCKLLTDENNIETEHWVTEYGNCHEIQSKDQWMGFEHVVDLITYDN